MQGKWDELEAIARRILNEEENDGLLRQLVDGYKPYLYRVAIRWNLRVMPSEMFDMLCNAGTNHGLKQWEGKQPLAFSIKNQFRKEYRTAYKLTAIVDEKKSILPKRNPDKDEQHGFIESDACSTEIDTANLIDDIYFRRIVRKEMLLEKDPCPKIMEYRFEGVVRYKAIADEMGMDEGRCRAMFFRNTKSMVKRMYKKDAGFFEEYLLKI